MAIVTTRVYTTGKTGLIEDLNTDNKTTFVEAINEINDFVKGDSDDSLETRIDALGFSVVDGALNVTYTV